MLGVSGDMPDVTCCHMAALVVNIQEYKNVLSFAKFSLVRPKTDIITHTVIILTVTSQNVVTMKLI